MKSAPRKVKTARRQGKRPATSPARPRDDRLMISVSGVRGVVGAGLTPTLLTELSASFATYCRNGTIVLGRDTRPSGKMARHAVLAGLLAAGARVIDVGVVPTPTVELAVGEHGAAGGIIITASHNPAPWNALKFLGPDGMFLSARQGERLLTVYQERRWRLVDHRGLGRVMEDGKAVERHLRRILRLPEVTKRKVRAQRFRVALDCVNGAGAVMMPQLLEALGCRVSTIDSEPTGVFSRNPEPVPQNLRSLGRLVRRSGAVVGFAVDPDADRLAMVGSDGRPVGEEGTLILALQRLLAFRRGPVVVNLSTSMATEEVARSFGVRHHRTPVGEAHVARAMERLGAAGGGEGNGGVLHPGLHLGRDAPVAAALILALMAERKAEPGQILGEMTPTFMVKRKVEFPRGRLPRLLERLPKRLPGARIDRRDGLRLTWPDRWLHVRGSGTEPIVRIIAEANSARAVRGLIAEAEETAQKVARP